MVSRRKRKADETGEADSSDDEVLPTIKSNDRRKSVRKSDAPDPKTNVRNSTTLDKNAGSEEDAEASEPSAKKTTTLENNSARDSGSEVDTEQSEPNKTTEKTDEADKAVKKTDRTTKSKTRKNHLIKDPPWSKNIYYTYKKSSKDESKIQYEVEEIIDHKFEDKTKYFHVRWKGFDSSADSWKSIHGLRCPRLLSKYYEKHPEASIATVKRKRDAEMKWKRKKKKRVYPRKLNIDEQPDYNSEDYKNSEWKVQKILDVRFHRNKKRDFLIRWQDYSSNSDSWEPEDNLDCDDLIEKFMAKLETITEVTHKEFRPARAPTKHFVLMTQTADRRLSRRHAGRQRAVYYDCDE